MPKASMRSSLVPAKRAHAGDQAELVRVRSDGIDPKCIPLPVVHIPILQDKLQSTIKWFQGVLRLSSAPDSSFVK